MLIERLFDAEMEAHRGNERQDLSGCDSGSSRTGHNKKILTDDGEFSLDVPRDRNGTFEPQLVAKHQRRRLAAIGTATEHRCRAQPTAANGKQGTMSR